MKNLPDATGLKIPKDFDTDSLNKIRKLTATRLNRFPTPWQLSAAAWNGLANRFRSADEFNQEFIAAMTAGDAPPDEERYRQERALFGFTCAASSALECFYFAAYCVGSFIQPDMFPVTNNQDLRFYPSQVKDAFRKAYPAEALTLALEKALTSSEFAQLSDLRNVLLHRGNLPRSIHASIGICPDNKTGAYIASNPKSLSSDWLFDRRVDAMLTQSLRDWLGATVIDLLKNMAEFTEMHFSIASPSSNDQSKKSVIRR